MKGTGNGFESFIICDVFTHTLTHNHNFIHISTIYMYVFFANMPLVQTTPPPTLKQKENNKHICLSFNTQPLKHHTHTHRREEEV